MYQRQPLTEKRGSDDDDDAFKDELDMHAKKITSILSGMLLLRVHLGFEYQTRHFRFFLEKEILKFLNQILK